MHTSIRTHSSCLLSPNLGDTHPAALYSFAVPLALRLHGPLTCFSAIFQWLSGRLLPVIRGWSYHYDGFAALWKVLYMNYICSVQHFCACAFAKGGDLANTVCQSVAISKPFSKKYPPLAQRARLLLSWACFARFTRCLCTFSGSRRTDRPKRYVWCCCIWRWSGDNMMGGGWRIARCMSAYWRVCCDSLFCSRHLQFRRLVQLLCRLHCWQTMLIGRQQNDAGPCSN